MRLYTDWCVCVCMYVRMNAQILRRCFPPFTLTHSNILPNVLFPPLLLVSFFFFFQTSFFWSSHLSPSVPSLVRFDFFHLPANLYFCFSPCPIITSLNSLHLFFSCYPLPPTLHYFPSFLLSACFVCVCMCMSGCVLARGLPGNVLLHRSLCPINITR